MLVGFVSPFITKFLPPATHVFHLSRRCYERVHYTLRVYIKYTRVLKRRVGTASSIDRHSTAAAFRTDNLIATGVNTVHRIIVSINY